MPLSRAALQLGLQLVQIKLGQAMSAPGFSAFPAVPAQPLEQLQQPPPLRNRSATIKPPKIVTTR